MKKIAVILNPNAKKFRTGKSSLLQYQSFNSDNVKIFTPSCLKELSKTVKAVKKTGYNYVCIGGGDGTIHLVLTELINTYLPEIIPPILILKEGTMDNIARSIKLKGTGITLLKKLISEETVFTEARGTIMINDKYCFLFGTGMVTSFLKKAYSGTEKGLIRNIQVALISLREGLLNSMDGDIFKLNREDITIDGKPIPFNMITGVLSGTVEHIGMGFSPLIKSTKQSDAFQSIIIGMKPRSILLNINKLKTGKLIKSENYLNIIGKTMTIKRKGTFDFTMDGDLYTAEDELVISSGPEIKLIKL